MDFQNVFCLDQRTIIRPMKLFQPIIGKNKLQDHVNFILVNMCVHNKCIFSRKKNPQVYWSLHGFEDTRTWPGNLASWQPEGDEWCRQVIKPHFCRQKKIGLFRLEFWITLSSKVKFLGAYLFCTNHIRFAIKEGFRHIDCAYCYGNEKEMGQVEQAYQAI